MTKAELVQKVKEEFETTEKEAKEILAKFEGIVETAILTDGEVPFVGGKFKVSETKERECLKNPKQPELGKMTIPASHKVSFKAGSVLKEKVKSL